MVEREIVMVDGKMCTASENAHNLAWFKTWMWGFYVVPIQPHLCKKVPFLWPCGLILNFSASVNNWCHKVYRAQPSLAEVLSLYRGTVAQGIWFACRWYQIQSLASSAKTGESSWLKSQSAAASLCWECWAKRTSVHSVSSSLKYSTQPGLLVQSNSFALLHQFFP